MFRPWGCTCQVAQYTILLQDGQRCSGVHVRVVLLPYILVTIANIHTCEQESMTHYMQTSKACISCLSWGRPHTAGSNSSPTVCTSQYPFILLSTRSWWLVPLPNDQIVAAASTSQLSKANTQILTPCVRHRQESPAVAARSWAGQHSQHEGNGPDGSADGDACCHPCHHCKARVWYLQLRPELK